MKTTLIPIGNSQGIRIPKTIIRQCNIDRQIKMNIQDQKIILSPLHRKTREGWDQSFEQKSTSKNTSPDDSFEILANTFDTTEWEWEH